MWWLIPLALLSAIPIFFYTYTRGVADRARLYVKFGSAFDDRLRRHVKTLDHVYHPPYWCPFGFMQTAIRQIFRSCPSLPFRREVFTFDDGGELGADWLEPAGSDDNTPIVFLLPGITGSTHDCCYILHTVMEAEQNGWKSLVVNPRGLGGVPLKTPRTYNAAVTTDIQHVISEVNKRYPKAMKIGCGYSMGGMILWNYMSKETKESVGLDAALIISSPWDPMDATFTIEEFFPRLLFNSFLANNLKDIVRPYKSILENHVDWEKVMAVKTVREFDKAFIVPLFGYKDWPEYYHDSALYYKVHKIPIPTLCLNSGDDCFSPLKSIPFPEIVRSENVAVAVTRAGGHTSYMESADPNARGYIERLFVDYCTMVFDKKV